MQVHVTLEQHEQQCVIDVDGTPLSLIPLETPGMWLTTINGVDTPVHIRYDGGVKLAVTLRGYTYHTSVLRERNAQLLNILKASTGGKPRITKIQAPMPGLLKSILVKDGQSVAKGQVLFTLEAMKMENAIKTPAAGIVKNVSVSEGVAYEKSTLLCVVEPE